MWRGVWTSSCAVRGRRRRDSNSIVATIAGRPRGTPATGASTRQTRPDTAHTKLTSSSLEGAVRACRCRSPDPRGKHAHYLRHYLRSPYPWHSRESGSMRYRRDRSPRATQAAATAHHGPRVATPRARGRRRARATARRRTTLPTEVTSRLRGEIRGGDEKRGSGYFPASLQLRIFKTPRVASPASHPAPTTSGPRPRLAPRVGSHPGRDRSHSRA